MSFLKKQKGQCSPMCMGVKWLLALFLFLAAVASLIGVYETHVLIGADPDRFMMQFGSTSGSLAILAFAISATCFMKQVLRCMGPCEVCS